MNLASNEIKQISNKTVSEKENNLVLVNVLPYKFKTQNGNIITTCPFSFLHVLLKNNNLYYQ